MKLKTFATIAAIAALPVCAHAQGGKAKVTNADAQKVVATISSDKAKLKIYCEMAKLDEQMQAADEKKDTKALEALEQKMEAMANQLGPDYVALMEGLQAMDASDKATEAISNTLQTLDDKCPH